MRKEQAGSAWAGNEICIDSAKSFLRILEKLGGIEGEPGYESIIFGEEAELLLFQYMQGGHKMNLQKIKEAEQAIIKAKQKLSDLCHGKERWHMSIPADPENDPDIVIFNGLHYAQQALAEFEKPAEESEEWDVFTKQEMWETIQEIRQFVDSDGSGAIISDIEGYAEAYHQRKCAECKKETAEKTNG